VKFLESIGLIRVGNVLVGKTDIYSSNVYEDCVHLFVVRVFDQSFNIEGSHKNIIITREEMDTFPTERLLQYFTPTLFLIKPIITDDMRYQFLLYTNETKAVYDLPSIDYIRDEVAKFSF
jgi:hypothetical protein